MTKEIKGFRTAFGRDAAGMSTTHLTKVIDPNSIAKNSMTTSHLQQVVSAPMSQPTQVPVAQPTSGSSEKK